MFMWRFCFSVWADERQVYIWTTSQLPDSNHCTVCMLQLHNEHAADGRMKKQSRAARQAEPWAVTEKEHGREQVTFKTSKWSSLKSATLRSLKYRRKWATSSSCRPLSQSKTCSNASKTRSNCVYHLWSRLCPRIKWGWIWRNSFLFSLCLMY